VPADKLLREAHERNVDIIGLSGLITPSLEEMAHVAREMQRTHMRLPLLIGGATTSRLHTAVKIAPQYEGPVVHVVDASRSVGVVSQLMSRTQREGFVAQNAEDLARIRRQHQGQAVAHKLVPLPAARKNGLKLDPTGISKPAFTGVKVFDDYPLEELLPRIDWSPFFQAWELAGVFRRSLKTKRSANWAK
jgi:5-methyltetrahydrofolate--homocysteine methyltransferase